MSAVFGSGWLGWGASVVFASVAALTIARLAFTSHRHDYAAAAATVVMASGMAAMALPADDPVPPAVWIAGFGLVAAWSAVALLRIGPISGRLGRAIGPAAWRWRTAGTAHYLAGSVLMLIALTGGHGDTRPSVAPAVRQQVAGHGGHDTAGTVTSHLDGPLPDPLAWLLGAGFLLLAGWWAVGLARGMRPEAPCRSTLCSTGLHSGCTMTMAVGMGMMALTMA